jgi:glutamyl-tRNA reductase
LAGVVQTAQASRQAAVAQAEVIIDAGVLSFMHWMDQRSAGGSVPVIRQLQSQAEEWRAAELARAHKALARGDDVQAVLEALSRGLTQKMLHGAMAELNSAEPAARAQSTEVIARLFLRSQSKNSL